MTCRHATTLTVLSVVGLLAASSSAYGAPQCLGKTATIVGTDASFEIIEGTRGDDVIVGMDGSDIIHAKGGDDRVCGNEEGDTLHGDGGADRLAGNDGSDIL